MVADDNPNAEDVAPPKSAGLPPFWKSAISAGCASAIAVTLLAPVDRAKIILQVQHFAPVEQRRHYRGFRDVISSIVKEGGYLALWRGNLASVIRSVSYQALSFGFKDQYKGFLNTKVSGTNISGQVWVNILSGGVAGCTTLSIIYPLDFARTRMACSQSSDRKLDTIRGNIISILKSKGIPGLYAGFGFSIFGVFIYRSIYFGLYDTGKLLTPVQHQHVFVKFLVAEIAATASGLVSYPLDTVRRTMITQTMSPEVQYTGSSACMRSIYADYGIKGFYKGALVNVLRSTGSAICLVLTDIFCEYFWNQGCSEPFHSPVVAPVDRRKVGTGIF